MKTPARSAAIALLASATVLGPGQSWGAFLTWEVPSGDWSTATNWSGNAVPTGSDTAYVVNGGIATVSQPAATCGTLSLGSNAGSGTVELDGNGQLAASAENVGNSANPGVGVGSFNQTGGTNTTTKVSVNDGYYLLGGGLLQPTVGSTIQITSGGFQANGGVLDCNNVTAITTGSGSLLDLSDSVVNTGNTSLSLGANSLLIVPAGFEPASAFPSGYSNLGLTHVLGTTLNVSAGTGFGGWGTIADPVVCQGTITASPGGSINVQNGLIVSGTGQVNLGSGLLTANDFSSGMSGPGAPGLVASAMLVGCVGTGSFTQSGASYALTSYLYVGYYPGDVGSYNLSGSGRLSSATELIGLGGTGSFTQSGGTHAVSSSLFIGFAAGGNGTYNLSGGLLSAAGEYVGFSGIGVFAQTGGTNATTYVSVNDGYYLLDGGLLQPAAGSTIQINNGGLQAGGGVLDCSNVIAITGGTGSLLDLSNSAVNTGNTSLSLGANSLLIVPAGFNPAVSFPDGYTNLGLTHVLGTTLNVSAGTGFGGWGTVVDPVVCQGTITASPGGSINLQNGLIVSGTGQVNLGLGSLTVNDSVSGMSGGGPGLVAATVLVGCVGTGSFTQSEASNAQTSYLYVGYYAGDVGSYSLTGSGQLSSANELIGLSGTGSFTQSGGTNSVSNGLLLGFAAGSNGTYNLSGSSQISAAGEFVGYSGSGSLSQSGGTNAASGLYLGYNAGGSGTYDLMGGLLQVAYLVGGSGSTAFNFSGGTLGATAPWSSSLAMNVTGSGSVDTTGGDISLSGNLSGSGGLTKIGAGLLVLSGSNSYSGETIVEAGTLEIAAADSLPDGSNLTVGSAAAFAPAIPSASAASPAPEPGTLALLVAGAALLAMYRMRPGPGLLRTELLRRGKGLLRGQVRARLAATN